ncbi:MULTISPECIES: phosphoglycolate phosphatase [Rhodobacterales]|uniref:phosphoglycolate phosphatase n=1 Tax=Rhodobacterales TaxID=204455 RepID=UPI00237F9164|nr:phosphoglycolate phosphatase [Phaeobacter gallaeciensis]MDE4096655.1 phosphoglycolate phosphatase [Phaeobacter gallaeciensis]MDE4105466.1 phosphoglycolate phosphatase [Phaeobacter gallaeciensis]MDE4109922.1 phosphoglycolate phosphatase [Phaeobacter gallaeciensis]MDE4114390.1 phosphoglycolate phosphatase [Phaeobacter gallaeciensis]MDE4118857.1 phosphoglycolate phosphatase [Phaeobacter gallaeciensis]
MSRAIVFDLDGTLVDSAADIHAAVTQMLTEFGTPPLTLARVTSFIGNGIPNLVRLVMRDSGIPEADENLAITRMMAYYAAHPADLSQPYPGVTDCLTRLQEAGIRLGVCTNKFRAPALQILEALDLMQYFEVVVGGDTLPVRKPDPAPLHHAFEALGGTSRMYAGDSEVDAETAQRAGIDFALFTQGYRKTPVDQLVTACTFDAFRHLPAIADRVMTVKAGSV